MTIATIAVVGAGAMGRGIAQIAAEGGCDVLIHDAAPGAAAKARDFAAGMLARRAEKGQISAEEADVAAKRIMPVDDLPALAGAQAVVEAIVENLEAKRALFAALEDIVADDALLATNTSSLSVTEIAAACRLPGRVAGFHFFNPVPLMRVVEVVPGVRTEESCVEALTALAERMGHRPVRAADSPGFLVNHAGRGFKTESLRVLDEGVTDFATIDRVLRDGVGFRMGPFELMDLIGLDVSSAVMEQIYRQFYDDARLRPVPLTRRRVAAGLLGRKSRDGGFYRYDGNRRIDPPVPAYDGDVVGPVLVGPCEDEEARAALIAMLDGSEVALVTNPEDADLHVVMPFGSDCTAAALEHGFPAELTVAVDPCRALDGAPLLERMAVVMRNPATRPGLAEGLANVLGGASGGAVVIEDSPGFIAQRVLTQVVNVAAEIALKGIAVPADIDAAVRLGLGYPKGPLEIGDMIGPRRVLRLLEWLYATTGDPRFRASLWLRRRALLGLPLAA